MWDLTFLSGDYLYGDLPHGKEYLAAYFTSDLEQKFLSYYLMFSDMYQDRGFPFFYRNFIDHSGCLCSTRWVRKLLARLLKIENALEEAIKGTELEAIGRIKSGRFFNPQKVRTNPR